MKKKSYLSFNSITLSLAHLPPFPDLVHFRLTFIILGQKLPFNLLNIFLRFGIFQPKIFPKIIEPWLEASILYFEHFLTIWRLLAKNISKKLEKLWREDSNRLKSYFKIIIHLLAKKNLRSSRALTCEDLRGRDSLSRSALLLHII